MKTGEASKTSLFLMEMVIALLFFSICSAICIRVFAAASEDTSYSRNLSNASSLCQSAAEVYKAFGGDVEKSAAALNGEYEAGQVKVYYDSCWNATEEQKDAGFVLLIEDEGKEGSVKKAHIHAEKINGHNTGEDIFSLDVKTVEGVN